MSRSFVFSFSAALILGGVFLAPPTMAVEGGSVTISLPEDGSTLDVMDQNKIVYDVAPGPRGDHVHVYVDNKEVGILRQLKGSYTFETLPVGEHEICVKVVNKAHVPIGLERCVNVTVE